jgi:hypothetical protein
MRIQCKKVLPYNIIATETSGRVPRPLPFVLEVGVEISAKDRYSDPLF